MHGAALATDIFAAVLVLAIPLTGPIERAVYRSNPATPVKLVAYGTNITIMWSLAAAAVGGRPR